MMDNIYELDKTLKIKVLGVGGAGNNAITRMIEDNVKGVSFYMLNTEAATLQRARTTHTLQLGVQTTRGLGAGANEIIGERAAIESKEEIKEILEGTDLLVLTGGMGGGTGTGAIPIIAELAKEMKILTIAIVTKPFKFEGKARELRAERGIERLKNSVDDLIVILNDKLLEIADSQVSLNKAFKIADETLEQGIRSITDLLTSVGEVNVDFADIQTTLRYIGKAYMGLGRAKGEEAIAAAVKQAIENPLTENKIEGARGIIINIKGNDKLSLVDVNNAMSMVSDKISEDANVIFGTAVDDSLGDEVVVTVIATGIEEKVDIY